MANPTNKYLTNIGLQQPSASDLTDGTTGTGAVVEAGSPTLTGSPIAPTQVSSDSSTKIATTAFVATAVANAVSGINPAVSVQAATTSAGDTSGFTYNNGVGGIGATFTGSTNTAVVIDGFTFTTLGQRLLVKNDTQFPSGAFNGVYYVTQLQAALLPPIFTRALDFDQPSDINNTGAIPVVNGTVNASTSWVVTSSVTTVGTDPITFAQFSYAPSAIALLNSPAFTGVPTAPTATGGTNTTQLATTAFVQAQPQVASQAFFSTRTSSLSTGLSGNITQNHIRIYAFYIPYTISVSTIMYQVTTADNTAASYDFGAYGPGAFNGAANVPLAYHTGTVAGTAFAPSTGLKTIAITGAPVKLTPGWYALAITSSAAAPAVVIGGDAGTGHLLPWSSALLTGGGATLPGTITAPALVWAGQGEIGLGLS